MEPFAIYEFGNWKINSGVLALYKIAAPALTPLTRPLGTLILAPAFKPNNVGAGFFCTIEPALPVEKIILTTLVPSGVIVNG